MSDLLWPGDHRAGDLLSDPAIVRAMVKVESAWLAALVDLKIADASAADDLADLIVDHDLAKIAADAETGGNPVIPLVALLRQRVQGRTPDAPRWIHRGLTSQDVLDSALQLSLREVMSRLDAELRMQITALTDLAEQHRGTVMAGRTLTQHAVPITFGLKAATWLQGLLDAAEDLIRADTGLGSQLGGAAGSLAAPTLLAVLASSTEADQRAMDLVTHASEALGLAARPPWHTARAPVTRVADSFVGYTDAAGRIANDVLVLTRPEIAELSEPSSAGCGASSAMPQKVNPVLSVLIRRAALAAPGLGAQLHLAAAEAVDERPDGAWHTEWATLRSLARRTVVAAAHTTELVTGVQVDVARMRACADGAADNLLAEARSLADKSSHASLRLPGDYLGANDLLVDAAVQRAHNLLGRTR